MSKMMEALVSTAACILGCVLLCSIVVHNWSHVHLVPPVSAQDEAGKGKTVLINKLHRLDPLEVDRVLEDGRDVAPVEPSEDDLIWVRVNPNGPVRGRQFRDAFKFQAGDDWLRNLSLVLKNRTSKNIVYVGLKLKFPQTKTEGPVVEQSFAYGRIPGAVAYNGSGEKLPQGSDRPILLAPGQQMTLSLAGHDSEIREGLERLQPFSSISLCYIRYDVYFEDGTAWWLGRYGAPDPAQPGKIIPMDSQYFPGPVHGLPGS